MPLKSTDNLEDIYPLSPMQQGMLFHTVYERESGTYFEQSVFTLEGKLDVARFERAWQFLINRHPILRSSFMWDLEKPLQVVHREVAIKIHEQDWRDQPPERHGPQLQQYLAEDRRQGFDLSTAPLIRLALFRIADTTYKFVFSRHHIVLDRWSRSIVLKEVFESYESLCAGREPKLDQPRPYGDYISWVTDQNLEDAESYWRAALAGFTVPTPIAIEQKSVNTAQQGREFADERIQLSEVSTARLSEFARAHKLTLSTLMQGAWALLLSAYAREHDVLFGVTVSGRSGTISGIESMVGLFINTLPLRVKLSRDSKVLSWLESLQEQQFTLQQYEYCSLLDIQSWGEVPRGTPLFETILVFENLPVNIGSKTANSNLKVQSDRSYGSATGYPLTLLAMPGHQFALQLVYDCARFHSETVSRMLTHLQTVLEELVVDPERQLSEISVLRSEEKQRLLFDWNQTSTEYEKDVCVHQLIERQADLRPTAIAATFRDRKLTYAELNARANQLARHLRSLGVGPESLVGICLDRSLEMLVGVLGILKAGGAYVPLDPTFPRERVAFMIEDSELEVLLTQESLLAELPSARAKVVALDAEWDVISQNEGENLANAVTADNLAYVIYTSGSTGKSKGVEVGHRALTNFLFSVQQEPGLGPDDVLLAVTTLSFDIAGLELYLPLISGARVVIAESEVAVDGIQLKERISAVTAMQATPATWQMLINAGWQGQPGLKVLCGGEALSRELANELFARHVTLWNMYGPTETTIWSTMCRIERDGPITVGRPMANTQVYLLDEYQRPVPIGVAGELHIGGDGLARGYLNRPQLTAEKFIPNPFSKDLDARLYKTGDLARYLANGEIEYLGRIDYQVKIRGFRIELGEIESVLRQHASVRESVVLAREDIEGDRRLVAYVIPERRQRDVAVNDASQTEQVSSWQNVWDSTYTETAAPVDPAFNIAGWHSSYTGEPIPSSEMREWVDQTVERILALKPQRVLEIGCGTGLLLSRLAPHCVHYHGTDLSKTALDKLRQQPELQNVTLTQQTADDFSGINAQAFDTVILNSVAQYFPSVDYFVRVLEGAFKCLKPGGSIFLGDLRSLPLLRVLHTSVEVHTAPASLPVSELQRRVQKRIAQEKELVIDPALFTFLRSQLPQISNVNVQLKRGGYHNELSKFRYDVTLRVGGEPVRRVDQPWLDWQNEALHLENIRQILTTTTPEMLAIKGVPDARLASDFTALTLLEAEGNLQTAGELRAALENNSVTQGIEPEEFWALGKDLAYEVELTWAGPAGEGTFDVVLRKRSTPYVEIVSRQDRSIDGPIQKYANDPLFAKEVQTLQAELKQILARQLPEYMRPSDFIFLDAFPLTPNGKVNRSALPAPGQSRPELEQPYVAPRNAIEQQLAGIWSEVLKKERVGIKDNFFEIGGHSLLATQVVSRIRQHFKVELPLRSLFESPTVAALATTVVELQQNNKVAPGPIISRRRRGVSAKIEQLSPEEVDSLLDKVLLQTDLNQ
jgi:amino acid adenylation domain-containing protein